MSIFGTGTNLPAAQASPPAPHPSSPIPVLGPSIGHGMRVTLGETGLEIFPLVLGGAEFGWNIDLSTSHRIIDRYVERGGNVLHTADSFSAGRSEHIIGQWLASRQARDQMVVAVRVGAHPDNPGLGPVNLVRAVEASLVRLGTDHIDVLYLDGADTSVPLEETLATAEWLIESGKVRHLAAASFTPERLVEARILASAGYPRFAVTPSHPLAHGFLSGRHRSRDRVGLSARGMQVAAYLNRRGQKVLKALDGIALELSVPDAAVAVAWLLAQRTVVAPIVNAYAPEHVEELTQGVGVQLSRAHLGELSRAAQ
jgi:aryl-alcohol dehydrogenase-like predicted oxidoreductase